MGGFQNLSPLPFLSGIVLTASYEVVALDGRRDDGFGSIRSKPLGRYNREAFLYRRTRHFNAKLINAFCGTLKDEIRKEMLRLHWG